jgi:alpha-galactosidase
MGSEIVAMRVEGDFELDASRCGEEWKAATPVSFCTDWRGSNADASRGTAVRVLWSWRKLYLRFDCRYRELFLFPDAEPSGRRDHLWDRDVVEAFVQPDPARGHYYKEFEASPNGMWVDLDIFPTGRADLLSGMECSAAVHDSANWTAEMAIPLRALTAHFDPEAVWRANFYRVEGRLEPRAYLAWQATGTPEPNFHVPSAFGKLVFKK